LLVPQGGWAGGFQRPDWLDPRSDLFRQIAATFYQKQAALFGNTSKYKMDLLHEGGNAGDIPVAAASQSVGEALRKAHPEAIWVLLGWTSNPAQATLQTQKVDQVLVVDGLSAESNTVRDRESQWLSRPYAFGMINNFGGNTSIGARGSVYLTRFFDAMNKSGTAMNGIAYLPEGTGNDSATFDFFTELAWRTQKFDQQSWFGDYSTYRYGGVDEHAGNAWKIMSRTAYSISDPSQEPQDSLFAARPSLTVNRSREWAPQGPLYDMAEFAKALPELLKVAPNLSSTLYIMLQSKALGPCAEAVREVF
jgi:alpha-N-acetylglucosaminidase